MWTVTRSHINPEPNPNSLRFFKIKSKLVQSQLFTTRIDLIRIGYDQISKNYLKSETQLIKQVKFYSQMFTYAIRKFNYIKT